MVLILAVLIFTVPPVAARQAAPDESGLNRRIERQVRAYAETPPDAQVAIGARVPSEFSGYYKVPVTIENNGIKKTFNFLLSKDERKLLYMTEFDLSEDPYVRAMGKMDLSGRPARGSASPAVTIVVYDDYQCPFCSRMYVTLFNEVMTHYRDRVQVVLKDFPILDAHPWAMRAAVNSNCLFRQDAGAYWDFSDYIHTHQQEVSARVKEANGVPALDTLTSDIGQKHGVNAATLQACLAHQDQAAVEASMAEGKSLGVNATPTMFVNGQEIEGVLSPEKLRLVIEHALSEAPPAK